MELQDTIKYMCSGDYKERFKAEYWQLVDRYNKLSTLITRYRAKTLDFEPKSNIKLLEAQALYMEAYAGILRDRAAIEGIELD